MTTFSTAFGKAGTCGGDEMTCETRVGSCETAIASALTETFPSKCEAAKRKAAGKLAQAELGCYEKAAATGVALDPTCIAKATSKFTTALGKAGTCPDGGSPQTLVENKCVTPMALVDSGSMMSIVCAACGTFLETFGWGVADGANAFEVCTANCRTGIGSGNGNGEFATVYGVAVDGNGNLFVADNGNSRIQREVS
jgi:hypothetical protein